MNKKHIIGVLGILVLVAGLAVGVALVQQQQEIRERANTIECGDPNTLGKCGPAGGCLLNNKRCVGTSCIADAYCGNILPPCKKCVNGKCATSIYACNNNINQCSTNADCSGPPPPPPNQSPSVSQPPKPPDDLCSNQSGSWGAPECNKKEEGTPCEEEGLVCTKKKKIKGKDGRLICTCKPGGSPSPSPSGSPSPSPSASPGTGLNIRFRWRGITSARPSQTFLFTFKNNGTEVKKLTGVLAAANDNGIFTAIIDTTGFCHATDKLDILIKGSSTLARKFPGLTVSCGTLVIDRSQDEDDELLAGDVNNDNLITVEDLAKIISYYTDFSVPARTDEMKPSDVNKDGFITIDDIALTALNWTDFVVPGNK